MSVEDIVNDAVDKVKAMWRRTATPTRCDAPPAHSTASPPGCMRLVARTEICAASRKSRMMIRFFRLGGNHGRRTGPSRVRNVPSVL